MRYFAAMGLAIALLAGPALAETSASSEDEPVDRLGECFLAETTKEDRLTAMRWMLALMTFVPEFADLLSLNAAAKNATDQAMGKLYTRLLTRDCAVEARPVLAARDGGSLMTAMNAVAGQAFDEIEIGDENAAKIAQHLIAGLAKYVDLPGFETMFAK